MSGDQLPFVRVADGRGRTSTDGTAEEHGLYQNQLIPSSFAKDGRIYRLNATPGQYIAVGTYDVKAGTPYSRSAIYRTYFAKELIGMGGADELQLHYAELISPGAKGGFLNMLAGDYHYRGTLHEVKQDEQTKNAFLQSARLDLADAGWNAVLK